MTQKKGLQKFKDLVKKANGLDVITEQSANKCSRRARAYICTYYYLSHRQDQQQGQQLGQAHKQQLLFKEIQKLQRRCSRHTDVPCTLTVVFPMLCLGRYQRKPGLLLLLRVVL